MRILAIHPYKRLEDWNNRLRVQFEMMSKYCDLKVIGYRIEPIPGVDTSIKTDIKNQVKDFNPDIIYVIGYMLGDFVLSEWNNVVYDMGSFMTRNILIKEKGWNLNEMMAEEQRILIDALRYSKMVDYYEKEKRVFEKAPVILGWETRENDLLEKIFGTKVREKVKTYITGFNNDIKSITPWKEKKEGIISVSAKWGNDEKNFVYLNNVKKEIPIKTIGKGGDIDSLTHSELMREIDKYKTLFVPFKAGGNNTVMEAIKLGCNIVYLDWYPFDTYLNEELKVERKGEIPFLTRSLENYYLPKEIPNQNKNINNIIELCQNL